MTSADLPWLGSFSFAMADFLVQLADSLTESFTSPQKRVFIGYLASAWLIALFWLILHQGKHAWQAVGAIFAKQVWLSRSARADYLIILLNRIVLLALSPLLISQFAIATLVFESLHHWMSPESGPSWPLWSISLLFTLAVFLLDDVSRYLVHRWMHTSKVLWRFHRIHHTATTLTPLTVFRTHPVEGILFLFRSTFVQGLSIGLFVFLFGSKVDLISVLGANLFIVIFSACGANLRHSSIGIYYPRKIENWVMSPAQHQIHHSNHPEHYNANFGVFLSIWDRFGRTLHHSVHDATLRFGVLDQAGDAEHQLSTIYWQPFVDAVHILAARVERRAPEPQ